MVEKIENINDFVLSKMLLKIIALFVSCFIIFNCVFSSVSANVSSDELSKFSSIQKDVFSAVFFVSNAIEKINFSLTSKIVSEDTAKQSKSNNEENKTLPCKSNDFIITNVQTQSEFSKVQNTQKSVFAGQNILLCDYGCLFNVFYNLFKNRVAVYMFFLFFASIKKLYDNILKLNINRVNPAFMHI